MGYYIETPLHLNKSSQLATLHGATVTTPSFPPPSGKVLVCVVQNGPFDAAGIAYDKDEFDCFNSSDDFRPKTWLLMDKDIVISLCPSVEKML